MGPYMGGCSLFLLFLWVRLCYINAFVPGRVLKLHQHGLVGLLAIRKQQSCPRTLDTSLQLSFSDEEDDGEEHEESIVNAASDADMSVIKEGIKPLSSINGSDVRVGIIMARWNSDVITGLHKGVNESLTACGVKPSNVFTTYVPGSYELPVTAKLLAASKRVDVIINLGCLIKGETMHFEYICGAVANGLMQVSLDTLVPCLFGVLTVLNKQQAITRSTGATNEGLSWGRSAVEMGLSRMAALGMDRKTPQGQDATTPFVTFKGPLPPSEGKNAAKPAKKIGF